MSKGARHINFLQKILPYLGSILTFVLALFKYQHSVLVKDVKTAKEDMEKYRKMWNEEVEAVNTLNDENLELKKKLSNIKSENIELKSKIKQLKNELSRLK
ncbi:MAG: hypothetical protein [Bacteriophage sp.]|nr:MAG: hypothetical protein [Bacteriophage sp.]